MRKCTNARLRCVDVYEKITSGKKNFQDEKLYEEINSCKDVGYYFQKR